MSSKTECTRPPRRRLNRKPADLWAKLGRQNTTTRIEQHIADPLGLHDVSLHRPPGLSNAAADFLNVLDDFRIVGLAGIAQALGEIIR